MTIRFWYERCWPEPYAHTLFVPHIILSISSRGGGEGTTDPYGPLPRLVERAVLCPETGGAGAPSRSPPPESTLSFRHCRGIVVISPRVHSTPPTTRSTHSCVGMNLWKVTTLWVGEVGGGVRTPTKGRRDNGTAHMQCNPISLGRGKKRVFFFLIGIKNYIKYLSFILF